MADQNPTLLAALLQHGSNGAALGQADVLHGGYAAGEGTGADHGSPLTTAADVVAGLWHKMRGDPAASARYEQAASQARQDLGATMAAHPAASLGAELAGAQFSPAGQAVGALAKRGVQGAGKLIEMLRKGKSAEQAAGRFVTWRPGEGPPPIPPEEYQAAQAAYEARPPSTNGAGWMGDAFGPGGPSELARTMFPTLFPK